MNILNIFVLMLLPLLAGLIIFSGVFRSNGIIIRRFAKWFNFLYLIYCTGFFLNYNPNWQFDFSLSAPFYLISQIQSKIILSHDALSVVLCPLIVFIILLCLIIAKSTVLNKHRLFYSFALFFETSVIAMLISRDMFTFVIALFFEILCAYILISNFSISKPEKFSTKYAVMNFCAASFVMIVCALLYVIFTNNSSDTDISHIINTMPDIPGVVQILVFSAFFLLSAVKLPIFPLHKAIEVMIENSNAAFIFVPVCEFILGFFIMLKFVLWGSREVFSIFSPIIAILGIINIVYFGFMALGQSEIKKSSAYFFFSQTGIILVALSSLSHDGINGAIFQCVSQSILFCALFICLSLIIKKYKTSKLPLMGGLAVRTPKLAALTLFIMLACAGMPFTSGFSAKFLCLLGGFSTEVYSQGVVWMATFFSMLGFILGALYLIRVFQRVFFGPNTLGIQKVTDILRHQYIVLAAVCVLTVILGLMSFAIINLVSRYSDMIISAF